MSDQAEVSSTTNKTLDKSAAIQSEKAGKKSTKSTETKIKLMLTPASEHPLSSFVGELKRRSIKDVDLNNIVLEALELAPTDWWEERLDEATPLEYRVNMALSDPKMREKLSKLLVN